MEIMEIIKDAFVFPSRDLSKLAVYIVLGIVTSIILGIGIALVLVGLSYEMILFVIGLVMTIIGLILGFILMGYQIKIIKSGIDGDEKAPSFMWKNDTVTGAKSLLVDIIYFIIPTIFIFIAGWVTNLFGMAFYVFNEMAIASMNAPANASVVATDVVSEQLLVSLGNAMITTGIIAVLAFIIFAFLETIAKARLANTDDIGAATHVLEVIKDIGKIGWGKVIATVILIGVVAGVIMLVISLLENYISGIVIISIVVSPYLILFSARATGLLYSEIA